MFFSFNDIEKKTYLPIFRKGDTGKQETVKTGRKGLTYAMLMKASLEAKCDSWKDT